MQRILGPRTAHHFYHLPLHHRTACDDISYTDHGLKYMNPPAPVQYTQTQPHHGTKRSAPTDEIETSSNISTEFKKLRLNNLQPSNNIKPTIRSVDDAGVARHVGGTSLTTPTPYATPSVPLPAQSNSFERYSPSQADDFMTIDDTPNRVYISDLDREIAEIEANESLYDSTNGSFFLPDVDKNISKIPLNILRQNFDAAASAAPGSSRAANEQALVLYRDPTSISVPEEEDAVRKAIIAARRNARERMKEDHKLKVNAGIDTSDADGTVALDVDAEQDEDRMDIE